MRWKGEAIGVLRRDGHAVGTVNATVNLGRVLGEVLSLTPGDSGEIPFAVEPGHKVHTARPDDQIRIRNLDPAALADAPPGARRVGRNAEWVVVTRKEPTGVTFGIARPLGEPLREIQRAAGRSLSVGLALIGLALIGIVPLSGRMTRNLKTLTEGAQQVARGNLDVRVPVRSRDEFGRLAGAFNQMAANLEAHRQLLVTQERLQRELELCRQIQNEMPQSASNRP
jgi:HAMP domain-containing protein